MFDGLLEEISEAEAAKIIAHQLEHEKIVAWIFDKFPNP